MKKLLLLMAAAASTLASSAYTETPLVTFDYSTATETPQCTVSTVTGANLNYTTGTYTSAWDQFKPESGDGVVVASGNGSFANSDFGNKVSLLSTSDKVGNTFCVNGASSKLSSTYSDTPSHSYGGFYGLHWLINPDVISAQTESSWYVRVRITFNAMSASTSLFESINTKSSDLSGTNGTAKAYSYADIFPDGFSASKYAIYEIDVPKASFLNYVSFKIPAQQGGNIALLVNKVEFIKVTGATSSDLHTDAQITIKDFEAAEDQTTIAATDVALAVADVTDYTSKTVAGSNEKYPAYYTKANAFDVNFTLTPDADKVAAGNTSLQATVEAHGGGGAVLGSAQTFTVDLSNYAEGSAIPCVMKNLPHRGSYYLALTKTKYNNETEENTIENGKTEIVSNSISAPTATFDFTTSPFIYKTSDNTYSVVFRDKLSFESSMVAVASFTVEQTDNTLDAGVLTSPWNVTLDGEKTDLGLNGYENRDGKDYDDAVHNWALIGAKEGYLPLHVANVNVSGTVTRKLSVEFPTLYAAGIAAEQGTSANATHTVTISNVNPTYLKASTDSATYNDNNELENAQTSVANIAVEANAAVEYFNLQGVRVAADALTPGIYVRRAGNTASKVIVK